MRCPFCGHDEDRVIDSRPSEEGTAIRRRRECISCGNRFTTYEKVETLPLLVVKKDGTRQTFDRAKLFSGIMKACEKRPVSTSQIDKLVDSIEASAQNSLKRELSSGEIGGNGDEWAQAHRRSRLCAFCVGLSPVSRCELLYERTQ